MRDIRTYVILFLLIFLVGCGKQNTSLPKAQLESDNNEQKMTASGTLPAFACFTGIKNIIIISGDYLIYSGLFTLTLPQNLDSWFYENFAPKFTGSEQLNFMGNTKSKFLYISLGDILAQDTFTGEKTCISNTDYNGVTPSFKETRTTEINNKPIFITRLTFFTKENKNPYTYITHLCFTEGTKVYDLVFDNYTFDQANHSIDSLHFD